MKKKEVLNEEIQIINPKIICCLGASATIAMLETNKKLKNVRGHFFYQNNLIILPTYHPAYLLRNPSAKKTVLADLEKIKILLQEI